MPAFLKTKEEFDKAIAGHQLVVIDFTASWCPPCKMIAPKFEELANQTPSALFAKVDVDENEDAAAAAGINCMPTFKFYKDGKLVDTLEGANFDELKAKVAKHV